VEEQKEEEQQQYLYKKLGYWQTELRSLGVDLKRNNELDESHELQYLSDKVKLSMYQDYKMAYSKQGEKHKEETKSTINV
jgi:hypothetical protein